MNTTLHYFYRDAHNYKKSGHVTFAGAITPEQASLFKAHLLHSRHLIPEQVRLPDLLEQMSKQYDDDAAWRHEFRTFEATQADPDDPRSLTEFVDEVTATTWNIEPSFADLAAMTHSQQEDLAYLMERLRSQVRRAAQVELQTSDQDTYGFVLHDIVLASGERLSDTDPRRLEALQDEGRAYLCNVDWDGVVGEDAHGHAVINL